MSVYRKIPNTRKGLIMLIIALGISALGLGLLSGTLDFFDLKVVYLFGFIPFDIDTATYSFVAALISVFAGILLGGLSVVTLLKRAGTDERKKSRVKK
jgi:hypothetical protein